MTVARYFFIAGVLCIPFSYATKLLLGLADITWVPPTLLFGLAAFLLVGYRAHNGWTASLTAYAFIAAFIGSFYLAPSPDRPKSATYVIYAEPARLALNIAWFWVCLQFWRTERKLVLRWLAISAILQIALAIYLYSAMIDLLPTPDVVRAYLEIYKSRQIVWFGSTPVYRLAGTFFESPPFGLFMVCCFLVLLLEWLCPAETYSRPLRRWIRLGAVAAFFGTVASLSDQVLVALLVFGAALLLHRMKQSRAAQTLVWAVVTLAAISYTGMRVVQKWESAKSAGSDVLGESIGERLYHTQYALHVMAEEPASVVTGIGPGRYGDYAARTGIFDSTVAPGVTPVEWMVEYGAVGLILIAGWLLGVARNAHLRFGSLGTAATATLIVANMFQMNWKLESWFLALAHLYTAVPLQDVAVSQPDLSPDRGGALVRAGL